MRATQLIRSRTRKNFGVKVELYQAPVILYNQHDEVDESAAPAQLGLAVITTSDTQRSIGGITVKRQVLLRRKIPRSLGRWTSWDEIQVQEVQVVGECQVHGTQRFECSIPLPARLPESRQTHYDQLIHLITATVHELAPSYPTHHKHSRHQKLAYQSPSSSPLSSPNLESTGSASDRRRLAALAPVPEDDYPRVCTTELEQVRGKELDVFAMNKKVFEVVHCSTPHGDVPALDAQQTLRLADSGKVNVKVHSDLFVLGSVLDLTLDFHDLTLDTTIHAFSVKLIQETSTPVKTALPDLIASTESHIRPTPEYPGGPLPNHARNDSPERSSSPSRRSAGQSRRRTPVLSRLSTLWASFKEKPPTPKSSILDEYVLLSEGTDHFITSQGFGVRPGSHLWRGEAGRIMDARTGAAGASGAEGGGQGSNDDYIDESKAGHEEAIEEHDFLIRTLSALKVHRQVRLPSEVHQAHASSSTLAPVLARITHRIAVNIIYSVLGQDALGKPLKSASTGAGAGSSNGSLEEGTMRQATLLFEVGLAPCTIIPSSVQPPSYVSSSPLSPSYSPTRSPSSRTRRLSTITTRSSTRSIDSQPIATPSSNSSIHSPLASPVHHARAFRASNGLVVSGTRVFYSDHEMEDALGRHQREKGSCACMIK